MKDNHLIIKQSKKNVVFFKLLWEKVERICLQSKYNNESVFNYNLNEKKRIE